MFSNNDYSIYYCSTIFSLFLCHQRVSFVGKNSEITRTLEEHFVVLSSFKHTWLCKIQWNLAYFCFPYPGPVLWNEVCFLLPLTGAFFNFFFNSKFMNWIISNITKIRQDIIPQSIVVPQLGNSTFPAWEGRRDRHTADPKFVIKAAIWM